MIRLLLILAGLTMMGCAATRGDERPREEGIVEAEGQIHYVELEGGFYGITTDRGARYYPVDLRDEFMRAGMRVRFRARVLEDMVTIQMWGTPVSIEWMEEL